MYSYSDIKNYIKINGWMHFFLLPLRKIQQKLLVVEKGNGYFFIPANVLEKKPDQLIIVRSATIDDLDRLKEINPNTTLFRNFLKNNDILVLALVDNKVVGHLSISRDIPQKYRNLITLKVDELYVREGFVLMEYRNLGIYSLIFSFAAQEAKIRGCPRVYGVIISNNQKSIEIHTKKFGFNPIFCYTYLKFLVFEKIWIREIIN